MRPLVRVGPGGPCRVMSRAGRPIQGAGRRDFLERLMEDGCARGKVLGAADVRPGCGGTPLRWWRCYDVGPQRKTPGVILSRDCSIGPTPTPWRPA
jgi:hypothetical protein